VEPKSENIELVSVDEEPNRELSEGTCQEGSVESGFATVLVVGVFGTGFGFFPSFT